MAEKRSEVKEYDGKRYRTYTTLEGISYRADIDDGDLLLWRYLLEAKEYDYDQILAPPPGKSMEVWGVFVPNDHGAIRIDIVDQAETHTNIIDSSLGVLNVFDRAQVVHPGEYLSAHTTVAALTDTTWVHVYGHIV